MSLATYANSAATIKESSFNIGDILYINADATSQLAKTDITVKLEIFNSGHVLQDTPLDTTHDFPANTNQNIMTDINLGVAPNVDLTDYVEGQYYVKQTISGIGVETIYAYEDFLVTVVVPVPAIATRNSPNRRISMRRILRTYGTSGLTTDAVVYTKALGETRNQFGSIDYSVPDLIDSEFYNIRGVLTPYDRYYLRNEFTDGYNASHVIIIETNRRFFDCDYLMFKKTFTFTMTAEGMQTTGRPIFAIDNLVNCTAEIQDIEDGIVKVTPLVPGEIEFDAYIDKMAIKKVEEVDNIYMVLFLGAWTP